MALLRRWMRELVDVSVGSDRYGAVSVAFVAFRGWIYDCRHTNSLSCLENLKVLANSENRYGALSRAIHNLMLLLIFGMLGVGMIMTDLDKTDPLREQLFNMHFSTGVVVLTLILVRIVWLKFSPAPKVPDGLSGWEKVLTAVVKSVMYLLMLVIPIIGILTVNSAGHPVSVYGLFDLPSVLAKDPEWHEILEDLHGFLAYTLLVLVVLHVAGALKHRFLDTGPNIDVLKRMFGNA